MNPISRFLALALCFGSLFSGCATIEEPAVSPNNRVCVEFDVPNPNWIAGIQEVALDPQDRLHVYVEVKRREGGNTAAIQMISSASDCVRVARDQRPMLVYLAGADWNWTPDGVVKVSGLAEFRARISEAQGRTLFPR